MNDITDLSYKMKIVQIGGQVWMAENLSLDVGSGSWCYRNEHTNCNQYERLYNWDAARLAASKVVGWHLPSDAEWTQMEQCLGMSQYDVDNIDWRRNLGNKLKSTSGWHGKRGSNSSGFGAMPRGYRSYTGYFYDIGYDAYFWTATAEDSEMAWLRYLDYNTSEVDRYFDDKHNGYAVRLVKD